MEILTQVSQNVFSMAVCAFLLVRLESTQKNLERAIENLIAKIENLTLTDSKE